MWSVTEDLFIIWGYPAFIRVRCQNRFVKCAFYQSQRRIFTVNRDTKTFIYVNDEPMSVSSRRSFYTSTPFHLFLFGSTLDVALADLYHTYCSATDWFTSGNVLLSFELYESEPAKCSVSISINLECVFRSNSCL